LVRNGPLTLRLSGTGAGAALVDEEISFRGVGYKGGDNSEDVGQLVDGSGVAKTPSQNFGCVEGTAEEELVTRPAVHGTTAGMRRAVYFMASRASQMCPPDDGQREHFWDEGDVTERIQGQGRLCGSRARLETLWKTSMRLAILT